MNRPLSPPAHRTERLNRGARTLRFSAALAGLALLMAGTVVGDDDAFPFGPFRMFSTSTPPDGNVHVVALAARMPAGAWERVPLEADNVGITRAETEGQVPRFRNDPGLLRRLVEAHDRLKPHDPRWTGVRLIQRYQMLRHRVYVGTREFTIAEWRRP